MTDETRTVDPTTGGEKGVKPAAFHLIPAGPLWKVAELYGRGAEKYAERNWERGYAWSKSFAAMMRHAWTFWRGEDIDPETGCPHLASVIFHAMAMLEWGDTHPELDDRPRPRRRYHDLTDDQMSELLGHTSELTVDILDHHSPHARTANA